MNRFVLDANIFFGALLNQDWNTNKIIFSPKIKIIIPSFLLEELAKYSTLFEKRGIIYTEYVDLLLQRWIEIYPIENLIDIAENIKDKMSKIDSKDTWYIALAEKLQIPLWTNDKKLIENVNWIELIDTETMIKTFL